VVEGPGDQSFGVEIQGKRANISAMVWAHTCKATVKNRRKREREEKNVRERPGKRDRRDREHVHARESELKSKRESAKERKLFLLDHCLLFQYVSHTWERKR